MLEEEYKRVTEPGYRADFRLVPIWAVIFIIGLGFTAVLVYFPETIPYDSLWFVGSLLHAMAYDHRFLNVCVLWVSVLLQTGQGVYQWILCRRHNFTTIATLLWVGQTTIFGYPSLLRFKQCLNQKG